MFQSAKIKLTLWYLLIIMLISVIFSLVIYTVINQEYSRIERIQRLRQERVQQPPSTGEFRRLRDMDELHIQEARIRLSAILVSVNLAILVVSGFAGYFLAGRTLRPIKKMLDEQNRFITDSSHELRTPITSLKSEIEVNLRDKKLNLKQARKVLESNLEEVNNLQYLSDNLIKLTQNQKTDGRNLFEEVSLLEILVPAQKKVMNFARSKSISIENKAKDYIIQGNKQNLTEVIVILLDNAIKYSSKGGKVILKSDNRDGIVFIKVSDQGVGISNEDLPHIFDRFYRADKSRTKIDVSGYGLGLSIAKQIVYQHGGEIKVDSILGKGTTVTIQLPGNLKNL